MSDSNKLINNTLIYTIGSFGSKALSFMLLPLYSYFLSKGEFGVYDLILTCVNLFIPIVSLQVADASYRWLLEAKTDQQAKKSAITNGILILLASTVVFALIYVVVFNYWDVKYSSYFLPLVISACLFPFVQQIVRGLGQNKIYAGAGILNTALLLIFSIMFLKFFQLKLEGLLLAAIIANLSAILFTVIRGRILSYISLVLIDKSICSGMIAYSWPLIPNSISWWMINASHRFIIVFFLNAEANGIYAVSARLPALITIINSIFMLAWQDHTIQSKNSDVAADDFSSKVFNMFIKFEMSTIFILIASSQYIVYFLLDNKFFEAWKYMPLLFIGTAFAAFSAYLGAAYLKAKETKGIFTTTIIGGIINVIISTSLIKYIGLYAPALGTFVSFFIVYILRKKQTREILPLNIDVRSFTMLFIGSLVFAYFSYLNNHYINIIAVITSVILFFFINKSFINYFLKLFKKAFKLKS